MADANMTVMNITIDKEAAMAEAINSLLQTGKSDGLDLNQISDGYHTFGELYKHRIALWIALCIELAGHGIVWRSKRHSDGSHFEGWFLLGMHKEPGLQITYHLPDSMWSKCGFAETLERAPEWDGHTSEDVLERLVGRI